MIRLDSAHIEEVRGIRKLDIDFQKRTFAISGPNGSGKSGVSDAIEVDGPACPLCDTPWEDEQHLRDHLKAKIAKSAEAQEIQEALLEKGTAVAQAAIRVASLLRPAQKIAEGQGQGIVAQMLTDWKADLEGLTASLTTVDGLTGLKERLTAGWLAMPKAFPKGLQDLIEKVMEKPDQTTAVDAQTFLTTAQLRLGDYREALRKNEAAEIAYATAKGAYETYCAVLEEELNALYNEVEKDFSAFYRAINADDESTFTAKLTPSAGKLAQLAQLGANKRRQWTE